MVAPGSPEPPGFASLAADDAEAVAGRIRDAMVPMPWEKTGPRPATVTCVGALPTRTRQSTGSHARSDGPTRICRGCRA